MRVVTGPRIAPLPPEEWDERLTRLLEGSPGGTDEPMHIYTTLARAPDVFRRWIAFGGALLFGTLPGRLRELVILRTAMRFGGAYEWAQHIGLAEREGVSAAEIEAVGSERPGVHSDVSPGVSPGVSSGVSWSPLEAAALRAVDETADDGSVSDTTWDELASHLDDAELIELLMLIAHYMMLTTVLGSLRVPLEPRAEAQAAKVAGGPTALERSDRSDPSEQG
jgi:alkylhydroperoxidase family enzyme